MDLRRGSSDGQESHTGEKQEGVADGLSHKEDEESLEEFKPRRDRTTFALCPFTLVNMQGMVWKDSVVQTGFLVGH